MFVDFRPNPTAPSGLGIAWHLWWSAGALPHLIRIDKIVFDHIVLESVRDHFLYKFSNGVQEYDGSERLQGGVQGLIRLQDNHRG